MVFLSSKFEAFVYLELNISSFFRDIIRFTPFLRVNLKHNTLVVVIRSVTLANSSLFSKKTEKNFLEEITKMPAIDKFSLIQFLAILKKNEDLLSKYMRLRIDCPCSNSDTEGELHVTVSSGDNSQANFFYIHPIV